MAAPPEDRTNSPAEGPSLDPAPSDGVDPSASQAAALVCTCGEERRLRPRELRARRRGEVSAARRAEIEAQVATCAACRREFELDAQLAEEFPFVDGLFEELPTPPTVLGEREAAVRLGDMIGSGAQGRVYRGEGDLVGRVAVKVMSRAEWQDDSTHAGALRSLARRIGDDPHLADYVVTVRAPNGDAEWVWYTMDLADPAPEGDTVPGRYVAHALEWHLRNAVIDDPVALALEVGERMLLAADRLHHLDLAHCDIKPPNIFRVGHRWKLGDFGLACPVDRPGDGTAAYRLPPTNGVEPDGRARDLAAIARTLFRILIVRSKRSEDDATRWFDVCRAERCLKDVSDARAKRVFEEVILPAWAPDPEQRIRSADAMRARLGACASPPPSGAILWDSEYAPPPQIGTGDVPTGERLLPGDLKAGRLLPRKRYWELTSRVAAWLDDDERGRVPLRVFWIDGPSGVGKSAAMLHLLANLHRDKRGPILWLDNQIGRLADAIDWVLNAYPDRRSIIAMDDPYTPGIRAGGGQDAWLGACAKVQPLISEGKAERRPVLVCCGPAEQHRQLEHDLGADRVEIRPATLTMPSREEIEELREFYTARTGKAAPKPGEADAGLLLPVQLFWEWATNCRVDEFAARFRRDRVPELEPLMARVLVARRLYVDYPCEALDRTFAKDEDQDDPKHLRAEFDNLVSDMHLKIDEAGAGGRSVRVVHPHLADRMYRSWKYDNSHAIRHLRLALADFYTCFPDDPANRTALLWAIVHAVADDTRDLVGRVDAAVLENVLPPVFEGWVNDGGGSLPLPLLPVWLSLAAALPRVRLRPDPIKLALDAVNAVQADQQGLRLLCHRLLRHMDAFAPSARREFEAALTGLLDRLPDWREWEPVAIDMAYRMPQRRVFDLLLGRLKRLDNPKAHARWVLVWNALFTLRERLEPDQRRDVFKAGIDYLDLGYEAHGWPHLWLRVEDGLYESARGGDDVDGPVRDKDWRRVILAGRRWLRQHDDREWPLVWQRLAKRLRNRPGAARAKLMRRAAEVWLPRHKDRTGWSWVWQDLLGMALRADDEHVTVETVLTLGCEWLDRRQLFIDWGFVFQDLCDHIDRLSPTQARTLMESGAAYVRNVESVFPPARARVWERMIRARRYLPASVPLPDLLRVAARWLRDHRVYNDWAHVWERLLGMRALLAEAGLSRAALLDDGVDWLEQHADFRSAGSVGRWLVRAVGELRAPRREQLARTCHRLLKEDPLGPGRAFVLQAMLRVRSDAFGSLEAYLASVVEWVEVNADAPVGSAKWRKWPYWYSTLVACADLLASVHVGRLATLGDRWLRESEGRGRWGLVWSAMLTLLGGAERADAVDSFAEIAAARLHELPPRHRRHEWSDWGVTFRTLHNRQHLPSDQRLLCDSDTLADAVDWLRGSARTQLWALVWQGVARQIRHVRDPALGRDVLHMGCQWIEAPRHADDPAWSYFFRLIVDNASGLLDDATIDSVRALGMEWLARDTATPGWNFVLERVGQHGYVSTDLIERGMEWTLSGPCDEQHVRVAVALLSVGAKLAWLRPLAKYLLRYVQPRRGTQNRRGWPFACIVLLGWAPLDPRARRAVSRTLLRWLPNATPEDWRRLLPHAAAPIRRGLAGLDEAERRALLSMIIELMGDDRTVQVAHQLCRTVLETTIPSIEQRARLLALISGDEPFRFRLAADELLRQCPDPEVYETVAGCAERWLAKDANRIGPRCPRVCDWLADVAGARQDQRRVHVAARSLLDHLSRTPIGEQWGRRCCKAHRIGGPSALRECAAARLHGLPWLDDDANQASRAWPEVWQACLVLAEPDDADGRKRLVAQGFQWALDHADSPTWGIVCKVLAFGTDDDALVPLLCDEHLVRLAHAGVGFLREHDVGPCFTFGLELVIRCSESLCADELRTLHATVRTIVSTREARETAHSRGGPRFVESLLEHPTALPPDIRVERIHALATRQIAAAALDDRGWPFLWLAAWRVEATASLEAEGRRRLLELDPTAMTRLRGVAAVLAQLVQHRPRDVELRAAANDYRAVASPDRTSWKELDAVLHDLDGGAAEATAH